MLGLLFGFFTRVLPWIGMSMVAPVVAWRRADRRSIRVAVVAVHAVAMLGLLGLLAWLQVAFSLETFVRSQSHVVREAWLPLVGSLTYLLAWAAWSVATLLRQPVEQQLESSVSQALRRGIDRLKQADIPLQTTPLYLVLGSPAGGLRDFFAAGKTDLVVPPLADSADQPVQVCGNREAIYIGLPQASLTGHFARQIAAWNKETKATQTHRQGTFPAEPAQVWEATAFAAQTPAPTQQPQSASDADGTAMQPAPPPWEFASETGTAVATPPVKAPAPAAAGTMNRVEATVDHLEQLAEAESPPEAELETAHAEPRVLQPGCTASRRLTMDVSAAQHLLESLEGVCHELAQLREPYCPINGLVVLLPLSAAEDSDVADHLGMRLERDFQTIVDATQCTCSAQVVLCDLESAPGGATFLERFPMAQRDRRLGTKLPAVPASEPETAFASLDRTAAWICDQLFPPLVHRLLNRDLTDAAEDHQWCVGNRQLHNFLANMRQHRAGVSRMLRRAIATVGQQVHIRGCFLAATGTAGPTKQAFAAGVMPLVLDMQNEVQWLRPRRSRDRCQRLIAAGVYVSIAVLTVATVGWACC